MTRSAAILVAFVLSIFGAWCVAPIDALAHPLRDEKPPRVEVQLARDRTYLGEPVEMIVNIHNVVPQGLPELVGFDEFDVEVGGDGAMQSSINIVINGQAIQNDQRGHRYQFFLTPKKAGHLTIPPVVYRHDGLEYRSPQFALEVIAPQKQDLVHLVTDVEQPGRYPLQPFIVRLRVFVRKLPKPFSDQDPISPLADAPPQLLVPWATPPEGLVASDLVEWLGPLRSRGRSGGFMINHVTFANDDPFAALMGGSRITLFNLRGRAATQKDVAGVAALAGREDEYFVYEIAREFVPQHSGTYSFPAVGVKGQFVVEVRNREVSRQESVFDEGTPFEVKVEDAPQEGRPPGFSGAFGSRFDLSAEVAPARARIGDPLTFTLRVRGDGNVASQPAPDLSLDPEFASRFKIETPTVESKDGARVFTYSLRALSKDVREVPPVRFSYFDVDKGQYGTAVSRALGLEIDAVASLEAADIVSGGVRPTNSLTMERADGLSGNITDAGRVRDERSSARLTFGAVGACVLGYVLLSGIAGWHERSASDPLRRRRRDARTRVRERLGAAKAALGTVGDSALGSAQAALFGLIADVAGIPEGGVTGKDGAKILAAVGTPEPIRQEFQSVVAALDDLRYARGAIDPGALERVESLTQRLIADLEARGKLR